MLPINVGAIPRTTIYTVMEVLIVLAVALGSLTSGLGAGRQMLRDRRNESCERGENNSEDLFFVPEDCIRKALRSNHPALGNFLVVGIVEKSRRYCQPSARLHCRTLLVFSTFPISFLFEGAASGRWDSLFSIDKLSLCSRRESFYADNFYPSLPHAPSL